MTHPYEGLPPDRFWRTAVSEKSAFQIEGLWKPKFQIKRRSRIATAGSCFAQHISRALVARGYRWIDAEPAPAQMTAQAKLDFHYGTFSFRTGNIYTPNMLRQWLSWAAGDSTPADISWEKAGRFYDPFRPGVEPGGFESPEAVYASRAVTIEAVRMAVAQANVFVFTLGLTESWQDRETGVEYAVCPGTIAGTFDAERDVFVNHDFTSSFRNLRAAIRLIRRINPRMNILLTVSPVPLTATASGEHVLTATSYSKSVLRAVAGAICEGSNNIDYFPSYEIITHPAYRAMFYAPNQRSVDPRGVAFVMDNFFNDQTTAFSQEVQITGPYGVAQTKVIGPEDAQPKGFAAETADDGQDDTRCEEEILDAFS